MYLAADLINSRQVLKKCRKGSFWVSFDAFLPIWAAFVVGEPLCDLETPS